ncbi:phage shock protein operon transcriptional activator [Desulfolutivibrio sulfoxidireducens]|uniref:phage shock protein operon transcriptional activator n=1 Tax=Desulfolutivibrio sulfoxidireducens TaxID=2773299 RepID=UPI00159D5DC6|nr:phage shock protein operon transcriptional activator [Desulfolutivibrio sulfoxidireducens]QLA20794.1 phage shock protein operon transcriptional activator [Desulfolutivibrio sulfoxidireducens]
MSQSPQGIVEALGHSDAFLAFQERLSLVARVDRPVILLGERGTGKELAATRLHFLSRRWEKPFLTLNCAALPEALLESELFGHEAGAFTGAAKTRHGRFESAHHGTLFLDEAAVMPPHVQEQILRVVEYGAFERLGASDPRRVDVRLVVAANADLAELARQGKFRPDLLDRLSFEVLHLPPLRCRHGDVELLARHFAARMHAELGCPGSPDFSPEAMAALRTHPWPGNVRELKNVVERAVFRAAGKRIRHVDFDPFASPFPPLPPALSPDPAPSPSPDSTPVPPRDPATALPPLPASFPAALAVFEQTMLRNALAAARHNQRRAAELLGLTYHAFRGLYRKYARTTPHPEDSP